MATESLEQKVEKLEKAVEILQHENERLQAINEIMNLVGRYAVVHTPSSMARSIDLFALKQPDVSVEIAMWGVFIGPEQIKKVYSGMSEATPMPGTMFEHQFTTPMIQVAKDGQTAKGLWFSPGHETRPTQDGKLEANWCWGKYSADFIKEDGEWKIWHFHFYDTFMCPYYKSWVDKPQPGPDVIQEHPARKYDKPPTSRSTYFKDQVRSPIPEYPEPYETWDGKSVC